MNKLATTLLLSLISMPVFAEGIPVVYRGGGHNLKAQAEGGLSSCKSEINQLFSRSDRLTMSHNGFTAQSKSTNQRFFYLNGKVDEGDHRKAISFACVTDYRGDKVVSLSQSDGSYERASPTSVAIRGSSDQDVRTAASY